jgi:hypothetical protein
MDIRKIALYLSGKLPPYYGNSQKIFFIRQLKDLAKEYYTNEEITFIDQQTRQDDEKFIIEILEDQKRTSEENFTKLIKKLGIPLDVLDIAIEDSQNNELNTIWESLIKELQAIPAWKEWSKEFENFWERLISFLLKDSFDSFIYKPQSSTESGTDIRDGIILNNPKKNDSIITWFWDDIVKKMYDSMLVTIEYKNYTDDAGQVVLYTTAKYLEKVNIGRFSIIFARNWLNSSAKAKQLEYFRWAPKKDSICFLVIDEVEIMKLITIKSSWWSIEEFLIMKFLELNTLV